LRSKRLRPLAVAALVSAAPDLLAQVRVPDDSIAAMVAVESRLLWRDISLADAPGLQSGIAFPLRALRIPLQFEIDGWTALARRPVAGFGDQYALTVHYQQVLVDRPHPKSFVFGYVEYWNPNTGRLTPPTPSRTRELTASALADIGVPQQGIRTVHLQLDVARDLARENATWIQGSASASLGTTIQCNDTDYSLAAILHLAASASDLRGPRLAAPRPDFGFHSADAELDLAIRARLPLVPLNGTTAFRFGTNVRASRLGANVSWVGIRQALLLAR
jgi:hypothetical protein